MNDLAGQIISRNAAGKSKRSNWDILWQSCANYYRPRKGDILTKRSPGQDLTDEIYDDTGSEAATTFAAGMLASLTPPGEKWLRLKPKNRKAPTEHAEWLADCSDKMLELLLSSNFYLGIHEDYDTSGIFCTSNLFVEEDQESVVNFTEIPAGFYWIAENSKGQVDTVFREWKWSARQAVQHWGTDKVGPKINEAMKSTVAGAQDQEFCFIHAVYPRMKGEYSTDGYGVEAQRRPIASCYVCVEDCHLIEEGGYYEMPYAVARLAKSNGEVYGRGPGIDYLRTARLLNRMEYDTLMAEEKKVNPPWLMPEDAAFRPDNRPGGVTYWDATGGEANRPEMVDMSKVQTDTAEQKMEQKRQILRRGFFNDAFQMLNNPEVLARERTAFQIQQMMQEKLQLFSPMFARFTQEKLNVILERVFNIMLRADMFDPMPEGMDAGYEIVYTSKIALAVQQYQISTLMNVVQLATTMVQFDPSTGMVVDWRKEFRRACVNLGMSADAMRSDDDIDEMMADMQAKQAGMEAAQLTDTLSNSVKNMGPDAQKAAVSAMAGT